MISKLILAFISMLAFHEANGAIFNDLKVTWGINPFNSQYFQTVPQVETDAIKEGWSLEKTCGQIIGKRYIKNGDRSVMLIFGVNGMIAGISTAIPKNLPFNFPSSQIKPYFKEENDFYTLTAYFVDPKTVCSSTRKQSDYGDRVLIKGDKAEISLPLSQNDAQNNKFWTEGKCFWTMGAHFWSNVNSVPLDENTKKDEFFPMFLLYNSGKLNGFGWALNAALQSPRYEHPTANDAKQFIKDVPKFLFDPSQSNGLSTIHIYLDSNPRFNFC